MHGTSDDAQNGERRSVMPARIGLAQPSRRLPIAAIAKIAATHRFAVGNTSPCANENRNFVTEA